MQSFRILSRRFPILSRPHTRGFASTSTVQQQTSATPWFVDPDPPIPQNYDYGQRQVLPRTTPSSKDTPPIPEDTPEVLKYLHAELIKSPHLELGQLVVSPAIPPAPGPALPFRAPHGRRKRGGTNAGESMYDATGGGLWSWSVVAQVKEGTENRGSIESVMRLVRKALLKREPPVPLAPKSKHSRGTDWVLVDAGAYAIHILSKDARERYFSQVEW